MAIPATIKNNFHTLERAFRNGDIALLECRNSADGEPAYAICAVNVIRRPGAEPEMEMVPFGLMFSSDPYRAQPRFILKIGHRLPNQLDPWRRS